MTVNVLIADDQALVRTGFRMILETDPEIRVVAEAGDGTQAVDAGRRTRPDVALMDIRMPVMDGLEATRQLLASKTPPRVLMLTTFDLDRVRVRRPRRRRQRLPAQRRHARAPPVRDPRSPEATRCSPRQSPDG
jgi:chemotaxis response regulator CheB